ncbi:MAG: hypothetical protein RIS34_281, partial [Pseudomonadota bacterium]
MLNICLPAAEKETVPAVVAQAASMPWVSAQSIAQYAQAFHMANGNKSVPFAVVCALGVRARAFAKLGGGAGERSEAATSADALRSIPHGNHGDNNFPSP